MITAAITFFTAFILSFVVDAICTYKINSYEQKLKMSEFTNNNEAGLVESIRNKTTYILIIIGVSLVTKIVSVVGLIFVILLKFLSL